MKKTNSTHHKVFVGEVTSAKVDHMVTVKLTYKSRHPLYRKIIHHTNKIHCQNDVNASLGDIVRVSECRPLSKLKKFTVLNIVSKSTANS